VINSTSGSEFQIFGRFEVFNIGFESQKTVNAHLIGIAVLVRRKAVREFINLRVIANDLFALLRLDVVSQGVPKL